MEDETKFRKTLRFSLFDSGFYGAMVGIGETYLAAFSLALGFTQAFTGIITSVPLLVGAAAQLFAPFLAKKFSKKRQWVVLCAGLQAVSLFALAFTAFFGLASPVILFSSAALYWSAGMSAGPIWNAWVGNLVPQKIRIGFFSFRSRVSELCVFAGLIAGGSILQFSSNSEVKYRYFTILFLVAAVARLTSAAFLWIHEDTRTTRNSIKPTTHLPIRSLKNRHTFIIILFFFLTQLTVQFSGPYFTPYLLKKLSYSYHQYMILISAVFVSRVLAYSILSPLSKIYGPSILVVIGVAGIIPLPWLWVGSENFLYLLTLQLYAGVVWASHELGMFLTLLDKYPEQQRSIILTFVNLVNSAGMTIGAYAGATLLKAGGSSIDTYYSLFTYSSVLRFLPLLSLPFFLTWSKKTDVEVIPRTVGVRAGSGGINRPVLYVDEKE